MKTYILFTFITMLTALQTHAMELAIFSRPTNHYKNQILPDEVWDKIIAYSSHNTRKDLKEVCTQSAYLTSINRLDRFIIHDFIIGDETEKKTFFSALIKTSNPALITSIITHAHKEAQLRFNDSMPDAVCIPMELEDDSDRESLIQLKKENSSIQKNPYDMHIQTYTHKYYLKPLLKEAITQDNSIMVDRIKKENIKTALIQNYELDKSVKQFQLIQTIYTRTWQILVGTILAIGGGAPIVLTILKSPLCFYNGTQHCNITLH